MRLASWKKIGDAPVAAALPLRGPLCGQEDDTLPDDVRQAKRDRIALAKLQQDVIVSTIHGAGSDQAEEYGLVCGPVRRRQGRRESGKGNRHDRVHRRDRSTAGRAGRLKAEAKQARLAKIRAAAKEKYVEDTIQEVETLEAETRVVTRPPEMPPVKVIHASGATRMKMSSWKFGDVRSTPAWFKTIDGYVVDSAAKSSHYVDRERTILVYERPAVLSHKSTTITNPTRLNRKLIEDIDSLRGFKGYRLGNIEIQGAGARRLVFTIDEEAALQTQNVHLLESWR